MVFPGVKIICFVRSAAHEQLSLFFGSPAAYVFHQFLTKRKALFLCLVGNGTVTPYRLPLLLEEALSKGFQRLLDFPSAATGKEKDSRFSFDSLA